AEGTIVVPPANTLAFEASLAALRFVLGSSRSAATPRILRPRAASTSGTSRCDRICGSDHYPGLDKPRVDERAGRALPSPRGPNVGHGRRRIIWAVAAVCVVGAPAAARSAVPPGPVFGRSVVVAPAGGRVLVEVAGGHGGFVRLTSSRSVPVGTLVDTTAGTVNLTSANPNGKTQRGRFFRGIFRIEQRQTEGGLVNLVIRDNLTQSV